MSRRKRKRKPKPDSKPASQVTVQEQSQDFSGPPKVQPEVMSPAGSVEVRVEIEKSEAYIELQDELHSHASSLQIRDESPSLPSPVVISADMEKPAPGSTPPASEADRRAHPRYAFTATAEVVATESGARMKARVSDLSQQGCYLDTATPLPLGTSTDVRIMKSAKSFEARATVVYNQPRKGMGLMFHATGPEQIGTLDSWIAESRETSWLAANRRRSQRVLMKLPVRVSVPAGVPSPFDEETHTVSISAHGGLLSVAAPVYRGQRLTLTNVQTRAALECVVAHIARLPGEQIQVGVEFLLPNPTFWRVAFPPKDWTPRHPHAKSR